MADDAAFALLARQISRTSGFSLEAYKDKCIRRRIAVRMRACGVHTYDDYRALLERTQGEYERLCDALTINVTRFYRNGRYDEAREAYERAAKLAPDLGDDLYFKLGNIAYKRRDKSLARESWSRATTLNPGHELARANLEMLDMAP